MKILAIGKDVPGVDRSKIPADLLRAEARKAWELYQAGVIREMYFRAEKPSAIMILECDNAGEARQKLGELPLMEKGLIDFDFIPLVAYPGFSRLFAPNS